jgi:predicted ATPase
MEGKKLLHSIRLKNLLSFGSEGVELELEPLNVLIGPNASGKSNFIDAISLLAAAPRNLQAPVREGGGAENWLWKGAEWQPARIDVASIDARLEYDRRHRQTDELNYHLDFNVSNFRLQVMAESLIGLEKAYFRRSLGMITMSPSLDAMEGLVAMAISHSEIPPDHLLDSQQSVFSQIKDPQNYPELTYVGDQLGKITIFRGWPFGRDNVLTKPQRADLPDDFLLPVGSNLGLVLNDLQNRRATKHLLLEKLRLLYDGVEDVTTKVQGSTIQILFHEEGLGEPIPASRLSDGTLHYLCLLTVLLHPNPPPLICFEEPELGLHPDIIPKMAELLIDAAQRTQLIVTTHSETLISALSDIPEAVVVCERGSLGTKVRRLDRENLTEWLERYTLGDLWAKGEIGGNRW